MPPKKLPKVITQQEFEKLYLEASKIKGFNQKAVRRYRVAMLLGFESGMRISEIVGLKYPGKSEWKVPPLTRDKIMDKAIRLEDAKGGKDRIVPRPKRFTENLIKLLPLKIGRRALQNFVTKLGNKVLDKKVSFHTLRHGFATHFFNKTEDIRTLQMLLGHSRLDTTGIYAHVNPERALAKASEAFE